MTEILLIRHGETDWNAERRLQGQMDIPLNAEGRRQAAALGQALAGEAIDAIFASDLKRAMQTAQAIGKAHGLQLQLEPALRERCYGALEGLLHHEINERYPEAYIMWRSRDPDARYPMGARHAETLREFSQRSIDAITRLAIKHQNKRIVIVAHGGVLDCIYRSVKNIGFSSARDFDILNAGINRLLWRNDCLHIAEWSNTSHLSASVLDEVDK